MNSLSRPILKPVRKGSAGEKKADNVVHMLAKSVIKHLCTMLKPGSHSLVDFTPFVYLNFVHSLQVSRQVISLKTCINKSYKAHESCTLDL